jgi:dTDP-4-amino-4,6-dideoxygalactose transaminase
MTPFNKPYAAPRQMEMLAEVAGSRHHCGDGPMTARASQMLRDMHPGSAGVLLTTSCTHALELAALLLNLEPGDEVIIPSFTFVSTANAFALRGATIRFADVNPQTLCMDPASVAQLVSERTRAIVPVHYAGVACDMRPILTIARSVGATVIEDNAHGLFARHEGQALGTFGQMSTLSFHETKNISAGEGGALVINDPAFVERAEIAREKGTNRSLFFRGMVDKYTWIDLGSSWLPSEYTAACLVAALEDSERTQASRQHAWSRYEAELTDWANAQGVQLPEVPPGNDQPAHLFYLLLPDLSARSRFILHMKEAQIQTVFHYLPLDTSPGGQSHSSGRDECPVTRSVSERLVRLPLFATIDDATINKVVASVLDFVC